MKMRSPGSLVPLDQGTQGNKGRKGISLVKKSVSHFGNSVSHFSNSVSPFSNFVPYFSIPLFRSAAIFRFAFRFTFRLLVGAQELKTPVLRIPKKTHICDEQ